MSFLCRGVAFLTTDKLRSSISWEELRADLLLLHIENSQLRWFRPLISILGASLYKLL